MYVTIVSPLCVVDVCFVAELQLLLSGAVREVVTDERREKTYNGTLRGRVKLAHTGCVTTRTKTRAFTKIGKTQSISSFDNGTITNNNKIISRLND